MITCGWFAGRCAPSTRSKLPVSETRRVRPEVFGVEVEGGNFGESQPLTVTMDRAGFVGTNVLVFPWNRFEVDGQEVPASNLRTWNGPTVYTAVPVSAGTHTVRHRFEPDRTWRFLCWIAQATLLVWVFAVCGLGVLCRTGRWPVKAMTGPPILSACRQVGRPTGPVPQIRAKLCA